MTNASNCMISEICFILQTHFVTPRLPLVIRIVCSCCVDTNVPCHVYCHHTADILLGGTSRMISSCIVVIDVTGKVSGQLLKSIRTQTFSSKYLSYHNSNSTFPE